MTFVGPPRGSGGQPTHSNALSPPSKQNLRSWWKGFKNKDKDSNGTAAPLSCGSRSRPLFKEDSDGLFENNPASIAFLHAIVVEQDQHPVDLASAKRQAKKAVHVERSGVLWCMCPGCFPRVKKRASGRLTGVENRPHGIFGVPLRQSITYANVAISLTDENNKSYIYGYVPIVVAKCGVFLKEKATEVEGIFRLNGSEKRIKDLKHVFDSPDRYGKGLVWDGFTVHDAANVLRRYLNDLPEPVVPLDMYEKFRDPLKGATKQAVGDTDGPQFLDGFDMAGAIIAYQRLITGLPPLNRQLLLYILDLLAVFAAKAAQNRMTSQNLAAIFQPGILSHPNHAMAPEEYRLNQCVLIFLIENQDHFLIGMQGTEADEKTVLAVQQGTSVTNAPSTPVHSHKAMVTRSSSNASAGAESVAKDGKMRRNKSASSRRSRQSNGAASPNSPALVTTPTGGLTRSNTVPSKRSPGMPSGKFSSGVAPMTPVVPGAASVAPPAVVEEEVTTLNEVEPQAPVQSVKSSTDPPVATENRQQQPLELKTDVSTPIRERRRPMLFQRSPSADNEGRQPNKLRKKRFASGNASAHSSSGSLPPSAAVSPGMEIRNPMEQLAEQPTSVQETQAPRRLDLETSESTPRGSVMPQGNTLQPRGAEEVLTTKKSESISLHSSFNEGSDMDHLDETVKAQSADKDKDKKKRWRLSRKKDDMPVLAPLPSPRTALGHHSHEEASSSSVGSAGPKRQSSWADGPNVDGIGSGETVVNKDVKEESKGLTGWIKNRVRGDKKEKEDHTQQTKLPQRDRPVSLVGSLPGHGKSLEAKPTSEESPAKEAEASQ